MSNRIEHIDIAKGISIALVAMFHSKLNLFIPEIIEPMSLFRMPLFFFLSGVFFSYSLKPKLFFLKKAEALLKPYFFVLLTLLLLSYFSGKDADLLWQLKGIIYGNGDTIRWVPLWFLTHLFALYVFSYYLFYYLKFGQLSRDIQATLLFCFMIIGSLYIDFFWYKPIIIYKFSTEIPGLPFSLDIIFISSTYFILGHLLRDKIIRFTPNVLSLILFMSVFILVSIFTDAHTDLNKRIYSAPLSATIGAIAGIYIIVTCSWFISKSRWIALIPMWLGRGSLFILIFHGIVISETYRLLSEGIKNENSLLVIAVVSYVLSISIPLVIKIFVEKSNLLSLAFFPFKSNKLLQRTLYAPR